MSAYRNNAYNGRAYIPKKRIGESSGGGGNSSKDPYRLAVAYQIRFNDSDGNTSPIDHSLYVNTVTALGTAQVSNLNAKFGTTSGHVPNLGDGFRLPHSAAKQTRDKDWTISGWVCPTAYAALELAVYIGTLVSKDTNPSPREFIFYLAGTASSYDNLKFIYWSSSVATEVSAAASFSLNVWYHVAVVKRQDKLYLFKDGILLNSGGTTVPISMDGGPGPVTIGGSSYSTAQQTLRGFYQDWRFEEFPRWISNFIPPTNFQPNT